MKSLRMERFLIQVRARVYTVPLYLYFGVKKQRKCAGKELASDSSDSSDLENVLQVMLLL